MAKSQVRKLTVLRTIDLTPNMRRLTLGGPELADFPPDQGSAYVKLLLPIADHAEPVMRTFTVRYHRPYEQEADVDFMLHGDAGPASAWAKRAEPGAEVRIAGPGGKKLLDFTADWFLLAGDMTALPAIGVNIEQLPDNAVGHAVIEILSDVDRQEFNLPNEFQVHWVVNDRPREDNTRLVDAVRALPWLPGRPSIWAACEFGAMRALRRYFKKEREVGKRDLYVSSYWKRGLSEDQHKVVKKRDTESESAPA